MNFFYLSRLFRVIYKRMKTYIALLRGVNVGSKQMKMEKLRAVLDDLKFKDIQTYVQSGNAIFKTSEKNAEKIADEIESGILKTFGFSVWVHVFPSERLKKILTKNPFLKNKKLDPSGFYVTFLSGIPEKENLEKLQQVQSGQDQFEYRDQVLYLHCPNGYGKTKLNNSVVEQKLKLQATTRNWNTIHALDEMAGAGESQL